MKQLPLEPAHRDESNGGGLVLLRPLDTEIFNKTACSNVPFDVLSIISASSGYRRIRPHHSTHLDEPVLMVIVSFL